MTRAVFRLQARSSPGMPTCAPHWCRCCFEIAETLPPNFRADYSWARRDTDWQVVFRSTRVLTQTLSCCPLQPDIGPVPGVACENLATSIVSGNRDIRIEERQLQHKHDRHQFRERRVVQLHTQFSTKCEDSLPDQISILSPQYGGDGVIESYGKGFEVDVE